MLLNYSQDEVVSTFDYYSDIPVFGFGAPGCLVENIYDTITDADVGKRISNFPWISIKGRSPGLARGGIVESSAEEHIHTL